MNTFMIKVIFKDTNLSGYTWSNSKPSWLECYAEVKAETLKQAVDIVEQKYKDKNKYWIKIGESYMKLEL